MKIRLNYKQCIVWGGYTLFSFCSFVYLMISERRVVEYRYIALLPFVFCICNVFCINIHKYLYTNIGLFLLHNVMLVRQVITPIIMSWAGFKTIYRTISQSNVDHAVILMSYECCAIYMLLAFILGNKNSKKIKRDSNLIFRKSSSLFNLILFMMTAYCLLIWIYIPSSRNLYSTVFEFGDIGFTTVEYNINSEQVGSLARSLQTLFKVFFDIVRLILPMYILINFKRKKYNPKISIVVGVIFALMQLLFISSTTARAIISAFIIIYFLARLYPEYTEKIIKASIVIAGTIIVVYFIVRFFVGSRYGDNLAEYLAKILNAYFGGIDNVAAGGNVPEGYGASTFWASIYSAIPFNSTLFGLEVVKLQSIYNSSNGSYGQIPPMIVEGEYYFGFVLSPIMSCICAIAAYHYGEKYSRTNSPWHLISNLFIAIMCAISIVMYNEEIILVWLLEWMIPMRVISKIADKEKKL